MKPEYNPTEIEQNIQREWIDTTPQCPWCIIPGAAPTPVGDDPHRSTSSG